MNKSTVLILSLVLFFNLKYTNAQCCYTIQLENGSSVGTQINEALSGNDLVCLRVDPEKNFISVEISEDIILSDNKTLNLGSRVKYNLTNNASFKLSGKSTLSGENMSATRLYKHDPGPTVELEGCTGCKVESLEISGMTENAEGITIDSESKQNEISNAQINDVAQGITIQGTENKLKNLYFLRTAIDATDCEATEDNVSAVVIEDANNNFVDGIMHRLSPGAITLYLKGNSSENIVNMTTEQEESHCQDNGFDPALYIPSISNCTNNVITINLNGGVTHIDDPDFCSSNTINNDWTGGVEQVCNGANLLVCEID